MTAWHLNSRQPMLAKWLYNFRITFLLYVPQYVCQLFVSLTGPNKSMHSFAVAAPSESNKLPQAIRTQGIQLGLGNSWRLIYLD